MLMPLRRVSYASATTLEFYTEFGNREVKQAALTHRTFYPDFAAMRLDDLPGKRQAQARTAKTPGHAAVYLVATLEDFIKFGFGDTDPVILHANVKQRVVCILNEDIDAIRFTLGSGAELDGVVE